MDMDTKQAAAMLGKKGGSAKSDAKTEASRRNGATAWQKKADEIQRLKDRINEMRLVMLDSAGFIKDDGWRNRVTEAAGTEE